MQAVLTCEVFATLRTAEDCKNRANWLTDRSVLCYNFLYWKVQETEKPLKSYWKENWNASKCYSLNNFLYFLFFIFQFFSKTEKYRKNEFSQCKNRANGSGGLGRVFFGRKLKNWKDFSQVLDFQRFDAFQWLFSGFSVAFQFYAYLLKTCYNKLLAVLKLLGFQRFAKHQASACPTMLSRILGGSGRVCIKGLDKLKNLWYNILI